MMNQKTLVCCMNIVDYGWILNSLFADFFWLIHECGRCTHLYTYVAKIALLYHDTIMMSILVSSLSSAVGYAGYRIAASKWSPSTPRTGYKWVSVPQWGIWKIHYEVSIKSRCQGFENGWTYIGKKHPTKNGNKNKGYWWKSTANIWLPFSRKTAVPSEVLSLDGWGILGFLASLVWYVSSIQLSNPWGFHLCHRMNRRLPSTMMDFDV